MKYNNRSKIYTNYNGSCTYNPETMEAYSYRWWKFVAPIDGKLVFNSYQYSNTTIKHQYSLRRLLAELGISIDLEIEAPKGLQRLDTAIELYERRITSLQSDIAKPRTHKEKNVERYIKIKEYTKLIKTVRSLQKKVAV